MLAWSALLVLVLGIPYLWRAEGRRTLRDIGSLLLEPKVGGVLLVYTIYVAGLVLAASEVGAWDPSLLIETTFWFFGTSIVLAFAAVTELRDEGQIRRIVARALGVTVFVEVLLNVYVFPLQVELALVPVVSGLVLIVAVAKTEQRFRPVDTLFSGVLGLIGTGLVAYALFRVATDWGDLDLSGAARSVALPAWLFVGVVPLLLMLALYSAYESLWTHVRGRGAGRLTAGRALVGTLRVYGFDARGVASIPPFSLAGFVEARSVAQAATVAASHKDEAQAHRTRAIEEAEQLAKFVGVGGEDAEGNRLDRRGFEDTKTLLLRLASWQRGWYINRGGYYRWNLHANLEHASDEFDGDLGVSLEVAEDGQAWFAWRRTITGWCFAIGALGPPSVDLWYDGPDPPSGLPGVAPEWDVEEFERAPNWYSHP